LSLLAGKSINLGGDNASTGQQGPFETGVDFYNDTGATLVAGTVVYPSSYVAGRGMTVLKSDADAAGKPAVYVVTLDTADKTMGVVVYAGKIKVAGLDLTGGTVGTSKLYLTTTPGVISLTGTVGVNPIVGVVAEATNPGYVFFNLDYNVASGGGSGAQVFFPDGTALLPGLAKASDTDTGFYGGTVNALFLSLGGAASLAFASSNPTFTAATDTAGADVFLSAASAGGTATTAKAGAAVSFVSGTGSTGTTTVAGGVGGAWTTAAGAGGPKTGVGNANGGAGGAYAALGGAGGATASNGANAGGAGGSISNTGGAGGAATAGTSTGGAGGAANLVGGVGGASTGGVGGIGGGINITGGAAGSSFSGGANGGPIILTGGAGSGTGVKGAVVIASPFKSPVTAAQTIAGGGTIALPTTGFNALLTTGGAVTGVILTAGVTDGQTICLINNSANSITFAAAGTSNVADGTSAVIPALRAMIFTWDNTSSRWYRQGA
jgi:hypothetical protein